MADRVEAHVLQAEEAVKPFFMQRRRADDQAVPVRVCSWVLPTKPSSRQSIPEFKASLDLAQSLSDHVEEKNAAQGLEASLQRQGKYKEAIKYHSMVLNISKMTGEDSGVTEAYGATADCYTELGELGKAGEFYDKYIARLQND
ncbi:hypothetical protein EJB05_44690, partial [Eragrostis curvula]